MRTASPATRTGRTGTSAGRAGRYAGAHIVSGTPEMVRGSRALRDSLPWARQSDELELLDEELEPLEEPLSEEELLPPDLSALAAFL